MKAQIWYLQHRLCLLFCYNLNATQNSYQKNKTFINSKLPNRPKPYIPNTYQILFYRKISVQDLYKMTLVRATAH